MRMEPCTQPMARSMSGREELSCPGSCVLSGFRGDDLTSKADISSLMSKQTKRYLMSSKAPTPARFRSPMMIVFPEVATRVLPPEAA